MSKAVVEAPASAPSNNNLNDTKSAPRPTNTVIEMIQEASEKLGVDSKLAVAIARCESGLRQYDTSGSIVRGKVNSKDVGIFQINEDYHLAVSQQLGIDIYTTRGNIEYGVALIKKEGSQPWVSSKPCWGGHTELSYGK
jgi:soluble lytic murein transglycosylase-like protein